MKTALKSQIVNDLELVGMINLRVYILQLEAFEANKRQTILNEESNEIHQPVFNAYQQLVNSKVFKKILSITKLLAPLLKDTSYDNFCKLDNELREFIDVLSPDQVTVILPVMKNVKALLESSFGSGYPVLAQDNRKKLTVYEEIADILLHLTDMQDCALLESHKKKLQECRARMVVGLEYEELYYSNDWGSQAKLENFLCESEEKNLLRKIDSPDYEAWCRCVENQIKYLKALGQFNELGVKVNASFDNVVDASFKANLERLKEFVVGELGLLIERKQPGWKETQLRHVNEMEIAFADKGKQQLSQKNNSCDIAKQQSNQQNNSSDNTSSRSSAAGNRNSLLCQNKSTRESQLGRADTRSTKDANLLARSGAGAVAPGLGLLSRIAKDFSNKASNNQESDHSDRKSNTRSSNK